MNTIKWIATLLMICILIGTVGCGCWDDPVVLDLESTPTTQADESKSNVEVELTAKENREDNAVTEDLAIGVTLETEQLLESGKLLFTITDASWITNRLDLPEENESLEHTSIWQPKNGEKVGYHYPDYFLEDGSFIENAGMVLVHINIKSIDAHAIMDPKKGARNEDPYLFDTAIYTLIDMTDKDELGYYYVEEPVYFSEYGKSGYDKDPWLIRLEPGESIDVTIGYVLNGYRSDDTPTDLSQLCLCNTYGNPDSTLIRLNIEE